MVQMETDPEQAQIFEEVASLVDVPEPRPIRWHVFRWVDQRRAVNGDRYEEQKQPQNDCRRMNFPAGENGHPAGKENHSGGY